MACRNYAVVSACMACLATSRGRVRTWHEELEQEVEQQRKGKFIGTLWECSSSTGPSLTARLNLLGRSILGRLWPGWRLGRSAHESATKSVRFKV